MLQRILLGLVLAGVLAACAQQAVTDIPTLPAVIVKSGNAAKPSTTTDVSTDASERIAAARSILQQSSDKLKNKDFQGINRLLEPLIESTDFPLLPPYDQHYALYVGGLASLYLDQRQRAQALLKRSSVMEAAGLDDWRARLQVSHQLKDIPDAAWAIATLARRWPQYVNELDDRLLYSILRQAKKLADNNSHFQLLDALYTSGWTPKEFYNLTFRWVDLVLMHLARNQLERAAQVARSITDPSALIILHADRRFDDIVALQPGNFDVASALNLEIRRAKQVAEDNSRSLDAQITLARTLNIAMQQAAALKVINAVVQKVDSAPQDQALYDDLSDKLRWAYDLKGQILKDAGRWQEAVKAKQLAIKAAQQTDDNISQAINLASLYLDLGSSQQALTTIAHLVDSDASPYGRMQTHSVRHRAAVQMRNDQQAEQALTYLRAHWQDAPRTFQTALLQANRLDEAASLLIKRLEDRTLRHTALQEFQDYGQPAATAEMQQAVLQREILLAREDVRKAIASVGRIDHYDLLQFGE